MKIFLGSKPSASRQFEQIGPLLLAGVAAIIIGAGSHLFLHGPNWTSGLLGSMAAESAAPGSGVSLETAADAAPDALPPFAEFRGMAAAAIEAATRKPESVIRSVELHRGDTLIEMLRDADVADTDIDALMTALRKTYNPRSAKAGQDFTLRFTRLGDEETFEGLTFQATPTLEISAQRAANGFDVTRTETPLERRRFAVKTPIGSSLYKAGARAGVPHSVMAALIRTYSHEIDFQRDIQAGDTLEIMYDQATAKDGRAVGDGTIIFAALNIAGKRKAVYRVVFSDGTADYFNERGENIRRGLLRTPIDGARMTSSFGMRRHPILGYSKMHKGVDFGAPSGTPIFAAGDGVVEDAGFKGAYGRYVRIRHNNKVETAYAHMSRFARGVSGGSRIRQGDVIGYVGASGRATGPHLHFEVLVGGKQVNPLSVQVATGRSLDGRMRTQFSKGMATIRNEFNRLLIGGDAVAKVASSR